MTYEWKDLKTSVIVQVDRPMAQYQIVPNKEECKDLLTDEQYKNAEWQKQITGGQGYVGPRHKGNWANV